MSKRKIITTVLSALVVIVLATGEVENRKLAADVTTGTSSSSGTATSTTTITCDYESTEDGLQDCNICRDAITGAVIGEPTDCLSNDSVDNIVCEENYETGTCRVYCYDLLTEEEGWWDTGECEESDYESECSDIEQRGDQECEVCKDSEGDEWETCWQTDGWDDTPPPDEVERTCNDVNKEIKRQEKEIGRNLKNQEKRISRGAREDQKQVEKLEKMIARGERKGFSEEELDRLRAEKAEMESRVEWRNGLAEKAKSLSEDFQRDMANIRNDVSQTCAKTGVTWPELDKLWQKQNKMSFYWPLNDAFDAQISVGEQVTEINNFNRELASLRYLYNKLGLDVPQDVEALETEADEFTKAGEDLIALAINMDRQIKELKDTCENWEECQEIWDLGDELRWAREDYWQHDWYYNDHWMRLDEVRYAAECLEQTGYMEEELAIIREDIAVAEQFVDAIDQLNISSLSVDIDGARKVIANGRALIENMEAELAEACEFDEYGYGGGYDFYQFDRFWPAMEQLGRVAQKYITRLVDYILDNPDAYDEVAANVGEEVVQQMIDLSRERYEEFHGDYTVIWEDRYEVDDADVFSGLEQQLSGEIAVMLENGQFNVAIIQEIANLIADAFVEKITAAIMNQFEALGPEIGNILMENNALVAQKALEVKGELSPADKKLIEEAQSTVYVNEGTAQEVASVLEELKLAAETGDNTGIFTQRLRELVDRAQDESTKGENSVEFSDARIVDATDIWFIDTIIDAKQKGIVSGYKDADGNLTGEFGPSNNVTLAEVTKMAAEASGKGISSGTPADSRAHGQWFSGYVKTFENVGLPALVKVDDWNKAATRGQAFTILAVMLDLDGTPYGNVYPDVATGDPSAGYFQTLYDLGIVTGEGDGNLNPGGFINRAAVAKIMAMSTDTTEEVQFSDELLEVDFDPEEFLNSFGGFDESGEPGNGYEDYEDYEDFEGDLEDYDDFEDDEDFEDFEDYLFEDFDGEEFDEISAIFAPLPL